MPFSTSSDKPPGWRAASELQEPEPRCPRYMLMQLAVAAPLQAPPCYAARRPTTRSFRPTCKGPRRRPPLPLVRLRGSPICVVLSAADCDPPLSSTLSVVSPFSRASSACFRPLPPSWSRLRPPGVSPASPPPRTLHLPPPWQSVLCPPWPLPQCFLLRRAGCWRPGPASPLPWLALCCPTPRLSTTPPSSSIFFRHRCCPPAWLDSLQSLPGWTRPVAPLLCCRQRWICRCRDLPGWIHRCCGLTD